MKCPKCETDNPRDSKYCMECATPLPLKLPLEDGLSATKTLQTPVKELATGSTLAGRYQVIEELGKGGMGRVYKVFDTKIKEKVALKLIKPEVASDRETIDRFSNELRLARQISHRNVCRMFDLGEAEGTHFITMEYVPGEDLRTMIRMTGSLSIGAVLSIGKQVCAGLAEAHSLGVVHRDLKPQNIMIDRGGNAKIMDFGIARSLREKGITGASMMIGTPEYMSPEQAEAKEVDQRSDIYSLGVILYEMGAGRVPFEGDTALSIAMKHKGEIPKNPKEFNSSIPDDLSRLILKCLEKDKAKRYQNAAEVSAELEKIEKGIPTTERVVPERKTFTSREITVKFSLRKLLLPAVAALGLIAAAVILWNVLPGKKAAPPSSAAAGKPSLAVMYFENRSGEPDLDKTLVDMLTTNLSRHEEIEVVSHQRLFDILRLIGKEDSQAVDKNVATEVANRAGVRTMLLGSLIKIGNKIRITSQLTNVEDGALIASEQVDGDKLEDIFGMVDELTEKLIAKLGVSAAGIKQPLSITDVTTSSLDAYRHYQKGLEHLWKWRWREAAQESQRAIQIDSTFALAYLNLALAEAHGGTSLSSPFFDRTSVRENMNLAKKYGQKATEKERLRIDINLANVEDKDELVDTVIETFVEKYPQDEIGYYWLGIAGWWTQDWEKARAAAEALAGNYVQAIDIYEQSFCRNPMSATYSYGDGFYFFLGRAFVDYNIAKFYEKMGYKERAGEHYKKFFALMKDADDGIPEVKDSSRGL